MRYTVSPRPSGHQRALPWWPWSWGAVTSGPASPAELFSSICGPARQCRWRVEWRWGIRWRRWPGARSARTVRLQRLVGFSPALDRLRDVMGLVVLVAVLSTLVSATIGVTSGWLGGMIPSALFGKGRRAWWLGGATVGL